MTETGAEQEGEVERKSGARERERASKGGVGISGHEKTSGESSGRGVVGKDSLAFKFDSSSESRSK